MLMKNQKVCTLTELILFPIFLIHRFLSNCDVLQVKMSHDSLLMVAQKNDSLEFTRNKRLNKGEG